MTKKEAARQAAAWKTALREHRVVKYPSFERLKSYPTAAAAELALSVARAAGDETAYIIKDYEG